MELERARHSSMTRQKTELWWRRETRRSELMSARRLLPDDPWRLNNVLENRENASALVAVWWSCFASTAAILQPEVGAKWAAAHHALTTLKLQ